MTCPDLPESERAATDPVFEAQKAAKEALRLALLRLSGEHPAEVYDEKGYTIWLESVSQSIIRPALATIASLKARHEGLIRGSESAQTIVALEDIIASLEAERAALIDNAWNNAHQAREALAAAAETQRDAVIVERDEYVGKYATQSWLLAKAETQRDHYRAALERIAAYHVAGAWQSTFVEIAAAALREGE